MDAAEFARKWAATKRNERAASQEHFLNLCAVLQQETPNSDPTGDYYAFEKGADRTTGGERFADVWLRDRFGWEYKGKLDEAVFAAYGWPTDLADAEILERLLALNLERAGMQA